NDRNRKGRKTRTRARKDFPPAEKEEIDRKNSELESQIAELNKQLAEIRAPVRQKLFDAKLAMLPEPIRQDTRVAIETPADKRNEVQRYLAEKLGASAVVKPEEIAAALDETVKQAASRHEQQIAALSGTRRSYGKIQALWDVGPVPAAYLYRRGGYETPGAPVTAGFPAVLTAAVPGEPTPPGPESATSGYRRQLAEW